MPEQNETHRQHVVSKTILRRFTNSEGKLAVHLLDSGKTKLAKPDKQAFIDGFIRIDSDESEARWKVIEDKAQVVYDALDQGATNTEHWRSVCVPIVLELIALHHIRSRSTYTLWVRDMRTKPLQHAKDAWRDDGPLMQAYLKAYDITTLAPDERAALEEDFAKELQESLQIGEKEFRDFIHGMHEKVTHHLAGKTIELGMAADGKEFLISDTPTVLYDSATGKQGVLEGVGVVTADCFMIPLNRKYVAAVLEPKKRPASVIPFSASHVDKMNMMQLRYAEQRVFYHPDSDLADWISNTMDSD